MHPFHRTASLVGSDNWRRLQAARALVDAAPASEPVVGARAK